MHQPLASLIVAELDYCETGNALPILVREKEIAGSIPLHGMVFFPYSNANVFHSYQAS